MAEYINKFSAVDKLIRLENEFQHYKPFSQKESAMYRRICEAEIEIGKMQSADVAPVMPGRWDDEHKCTICRNEAFCKISNIRPDYDYDWEENLVETGGYIWDTEWLETAYCPHCGAKMDGGATNAQT